MDDLGRRPSTADLSAELGVTERTLRACCSELLGISAVRYKNWKMYYTMS
jgi:hypothetical protein